MWLVRLISALLEERSWRYDYETGSRMWRRRGGQIKYRPATRDEIEQERQDATMQQW